MTGLFSFSLNQEVDIQSIISNQMICITGTDTGIGKTVVTGLLAKKCHAHKSVVTQKWVQSGDLDSPDIQTHDQLSTQIIDTKWLSDRQVYSFDDPVSPHLAARLANQTIDPDMLKQATNRLVTSFDMVLVETSGGIMVPLTDSITTGDVVAEMGMPTIVVVPNKLGTINHSLLTLNYLKQRQVSVLGFIMNQFDTNQSPLQADNPRIIQALSNVKWMGTIRHL